MIIQLIFLLLGLVGIYKTTQNILKYRKLMAAYHSDKSDHRRFGDANHPANE